jgi:hypothetical protein
VEGIGFAEPALDSPVGLYVAPKGDPDAAILTKTSTLLQNVGEIDLTWRGVAYDTYRFQKLTNWKPTLADTRIQGLLATSWVKDAIVIATISTTENFQNLRMVPTDPVGKCNRLQRSLTSQLVVNRDGLGSCGDSDHQIVAAVELRERHTGRGDIAECNVDVELPGASIKSLPPADV